MFKRGILFALTVVMCLAQAPIRVAVMGRTTGLPLFDSLAVLGRDETLRRINVALSRLAAAP